MSKTMSKMAKSGTWQITNVVDLGTMAGNCDICGHGIRYEYHVKRSGDDNPSLAMENLVVGSSCGPKLVDLSTWKDMNKAYVAKTQVGLSPDTFKAMMARYVTLKPSHNFMKSINELVQSGFRLSPAQLDVVEKVFSETDWEALEASRGVCELIDTFLPKVKNEKTKALLESLKGWAAVKPLTPKQFQVLKKIETEVKGEART